MPVPILPLFSEGMTIINERFAVETRNDVVYWFQGSLPVFRHHKDDQKLFRDFCCQMINLGNATAADLGRALKVNCEKLSRWARQDSAASEKVMSSVSSKSRSKKKAMF